MVFMEKKVQHGTCPTHGRVEGTRDVPKMTFPFIYSGIKRMLARRQALKCPTCGSDLTSE